MFGLSSDYPDIVPNAHYANCFWKVVTVLTKPLIRWISLTVTLLCTTAVLYAQGNQVVSPESGKEYNAGIKLFSEGKHAPALEHFTKAAQLDPKNVAAIFAQGLALSKLNRPKEAAERFTAVLKVDPVHAKALQALPAALYQAGEVEGALEAYDRGIEKTPKQMELYTGKAVILIRQKKYGDAVQILDKAQKLDPKNVKILETTAYVLAESGRLKEAAELAEKILAVNRTNARAHVILGDNLRLSRKYSEALSHYQAASKNLETRAYAEHFIEVIKKQQEDEEIEREYELRQQKK